MKYIFVAAAFLVSMTSSSFGQQIYSWSNLPEIKEPIFKNDTVNILDYGAVPDGITLNTEAINKAMADLSAKGGGVVLVPSGYWLTGPIELKSGVNLHLAKNALLSFTADASAYPLIEDNTDGHPVVSVQSPISGEGLENVAITGHGILDGNGDAWRPVKKVKMTEGEWKAKLASGGVLSSDGSVWHPDQATKEAEESHMSRSLSGGKTLEDFEPVKRLLRPNLLLVRNSKKVLFEGVTFQNSPGWCVHPELIEDLTIRNVYIKNPDYAQNGDGLDVESCKNVLIESNRLDVGDDGICIKSGKDEAGRKRGKATENVIVRDNIVYKGHGGFTIGSEMSGGVHNVFVYDCTFIGTDIGLRFKTTRGRGGVVDNIFIRNINMKDIVNDAVSFDMYYFTKPGAPVPPVTEQTPQFKDFFIDNIVCDGAKTGLLIRGLPEMAIQNIHFSDMVVRAQEGAALIEADGIEFTNVKFITDSKLPVIKLENARNIGLTHIEADLSGKVFLVSQGKQTKNVEITDTKLPNGLKDIQLGADVSKDAVKIQ